MSLWLVLLAVSAPFVAAAVATAFHHLLRRHLVHVDSSELPVTAGTWALGAIRRQGAEHRLRAGVTADEVGGQDAFWPELGFVGLSRRTWYGRHPVRWAVASHELGHAFTQLHQPSLSRLFAAARLGLHLSSQAFAALALVDLLYGSHMVWALALAALVASTLSAAVVMVDEALASRTGLRLLQADKRLGPSQLRTVRAALSSALAIYGAGLAARLALIPAWSVLSESLVFQGDAGLGRISHAATWAVIILCPVPLLRAAQLVGRVRKPEAMGSEMHMAWVALQEGRWAVQTGLVLAFWILLIHDTHLGVGLLPLVVLAALPAVIPLTQVGRVAALVPVALVVHLATGLAERRGWLGPSEEIREPVGPPDPMPVTDAGVGWGARAGALAQLSFVPLLVVLLVRVASGW